MFSKELEVSINQAYQEARDRRHEYLTVEHMLLALLENGSALAVLRACETDVGSLENELRKVLADNVPVLEDEDRDPQPTVSFQRVLQRALYHVQSAGKDEVLGVNVLVAIFSEKDSYSTYLLNRHDVTRLDVVNYISHGISKRNSEADDEGGPAAAAEDVEGQKQATALQQFTTDLNQRARNGQIDPLIGRAKETQRTVQVLCRRRKNNPLYVGDAGVGKTALAEGLARMMVRAFKDALSENMVSRAGAFLARPSLRRMLAHLDPAAHNGAPLLGLNGVVIKSHGSADGRGLSRAILEAGRQARRQVHREIEHSIREYRLEKST